MIFEEIAGRHQTDKRTEAKYDKEKWAALVKRDGFYGEPLVTPNEDGKTLNASFIALTDDGLDVIMRTAPENIKSDITWIQLMYNQLKKPSFLDGYNNLKRLDLRMNHALRTLDVSQLKGLTELQINGCNKLQEIKLPDSLRLIEIGAKHEDIIKKRKDLDIQKGTKACYDLVISVYKQHLNILKQKSEYLSVAKTHNKIGTIYKNQGKFDEAIDHHRLALAIQLKELGTNHPDVADTYTNMENVYTEEGKFNEAQHHRRLALEIYLKKLGSDHPDVAISMEDHDSQGNFNEALRHIN